MRQITFRNEGVNAPFVTGLGIAALSLAALQVGAAPVGPGGETIEIHAETIAYAGHGKLFDEHMNEIKIDAPFIGDIQNAMMDDIAQMLVQELPAESAERFEEAQQLLDSGELRADEEILLKSGMMGLMLKDAQDELRKKHAWRNSALASHYLQYLDAMVEFDPESTQQIKDGILDMLPQVMPPEDDDDDSGGGETAYMAACRSQDVPIPPDWAEQGTDWVFQGTLTQNILVPGAYAGVWSYRDPSLRGACVALPRGNGSYGNPAGIICQSASTGHACFWDNKLKSEPSRQYIGWRGLTLEISKLRDGTDLRENCTSCHRGNNVFLMAPDDPTWAMLMRGPLNGTLTTQVESSSDNQGGHPRYIPITTSPPRPGWDNPFAQGGCAGACHEPPSFQVATRAATINLKMPPDCTLGSATDPIKCYTPPKLGMRRSLSFGSLPQPEVSTRMLRISNTLGGAPLSVSIQASPPPPAGQPISGFFWGPLSTVIVPGGSETFMINFSPRATASFTGRLSVLTNVSHSPLTVTLTGRGLPPRNPAH